MNILIVIPGFGAPNLDHKKELYNHNINILTKTLPECIFDVRIFNYDCTSYKLDNAKTFHKNIRDISENLIKGTVGEFLYKYVTPESVANYDYIVIILDDIRLCNNFNTSIFLKNYKVHGLDILSPALSLDSVDTPHKIMFQKGAGFLRITSVAECFFYFMSKNAYSKYHKLLDSRTRWLWGIDFALQYNNIKCGIFDYYTMTHFYKNTCYKDGQRKIAFEELEYNKKRFKYSKLVSNTIKLVFPILK